jgi:PKD repeat protein
VPAGQARVKTWRLRNDGSTTWHSSYRLAFTGGDQMGAPVSVNLPNAVAPGEEVEVSVNLTAPPVGGNYEGDWQMRNAQGVYFGDLLWVKVTVPSGVTPTPPPGGGDPITIQAVEYPSVVVPGQSFRPRITVKVNQGQLLQSRGDLLRNTDGNLYDAWPHVAVVGTVSAGGSYTFEFYEDNPIIAPSADGTYESKWRVWRDGTWAGPEINLRFDVRGGGGTRPSPPTLTGPGDWYVSRDGSTPALCASAPAGLQYYFQVYDSHDIPESGWISNNCWTPQGLGAYGYQWRARVRETNTGLVSDWSETRHFSIDSQELSLDDFAFIPASPSASDEVRVRTCVQGFGGIGNALEIWANTATDCSESGSWLWIDPKGTFCYDPAKPEEWAEFHTRALSDGCHLIRAIGFHGDLQTVKDTTYTLQRRRPANVQLINPGQHEWFHEHTITFRWEPEESQRTNYFSFHVSTNSDPLVNPIVSQTFGGSVREYTYTFGQDYSSLYWRLQACNELGCSDAAIGHFGIDRTVPATAVNSLSATTYETVFQVSWTGGNDNASSIRWYDVQYRDGERGEWVDWQTNVVGTVAIFVGQTGHKYYFRARALDNAGNLEAYAEGNGDTVTTVDPTAAPGTPWWDLAYAHKRNLLISNNVGNVMKAGYPVRLHFDSGTVPTAAEIYAASQSATKDNDVRLVYRNATQLSRWVQSFTSSRIDIWFKTQADIAGSASNGTDYQLYYGNPSAASPPANIDDVMPPGRDAYTLGLWHFSEGTGTAIADTSGAGGNASVYTQTGSNWQWEQYGKFGSYVRYFNQPQDGNGAWTEVGNGSGLAPSRLTVEAWVRMDAQPAEAVMVGKRYSGDQPAWSMLLLGAQPACEFNYARTQGYSQPLVAGRWEHVACTYDGSTLRVYQNGVLTRQDAASKSPLSDSSPLRIGKGGNNSQFFGGAVQHVRVSNVARTDFSYARNLAAITVEPSLAAGDPIEPPATGTANLALLDVNTYPNPEGGLIVEALVQNQGDRETQNGFYTDVYLDHLPTGPGDYTGSIRYWIASPIEAGATLSLTLLLTDTTPIAPAESMALLDATSETSGTIYVQTDSTGVVGEMSEEDNVSTGAQFCLAAPDGYEVDDASAQAKELALDVAQHHNFDHPEDEDWLWFTAQEGISYTVETFGLALATDTYLALYDTDGTTLLAANDDHDGSLASRIEWQAPAAGSYYLVVKHWNPNAGGCATSYDIVLHMAVRARFVAEPTAGQAPLEVQFTNKSTGDYTESLWDFGDGTTSTLEHPSHTYSSGTYTVSLTVTGPGGTDTTARSDLIVVAPGSMQASFSAAPTTGPAPLAVAFTNTSTGVFATSLWDFGDGGTSIDHNPTHIYGSTETYTVSLTIEGPGGTDTMTRPDYIVVEEPLTHTVTYFITQGSDDAGTGGWCGYSPYHGEIYLGKCINGQGITSGLRFAGVAIPRGAQILDGHIRVVVDGPYTNDIAVRLFGEATGNAQTFSDTDSPSDRPLGSASVSWDIPGSDVWQPGQTHSSPDVAAIVHEIVHRSDWQSGNAMVFIVADDAPPDGPVEHRRAMAYERYGSPEYAARLEVTYAEPALLADFVASPLSGIAPLTTVFTDTSTGEVDTWLWTFGDGVTSALTGPVHTYLDAGVYSVSLLVGGPRGSHVVTRTDLITVGAGQDRVYLPLVLH